MTDQTQNASTKTLESGTVRMASALQSDVEALLGATAKRPWWLRKRLWLSVLIGALGYGAWFYWQGEQERLSTPIYLSEPVSQGDITLSVLANGTLQPTRTVNIGSELSGTVRNVLVDVNDRVKAGQVLLELDTAKLQDQVVRSRSALESAQAQLQQQEATSQETKTALARLREVAKLSSGKLPAQAELDAATAAHDRALAGVAGAKANVSSAQAALASDETNLAKASVRSPINGVVLSRSVDPGNAVAASLQAVTLFTIAEDLRSLRLQVNVDEADVGRVAAGQKASFSVSAYPNRRYPATVSRVAFGSTVNDNVVTYQTHLAVQNQDLSLRPGMTATSTIVAIERKQVLRVPNKALRFRPRAPTQDDARERGGILASVFPRFSRGGSPKAVTGGQPGRQVWVLDKGQPKAVAVKVGISDGRMTEILEGELTVGMSVIVEQKNQAASKPAS